MTKLFLAAGVAALAIAAPAGAEKGGRGDDKGGQAASAKQGGGLSGQRAQRAERREMPRMERQQRSIQRSDRQQRLAAMQERRERAPRLERTQRSEQRAAQRADRPQRVDRAERQQQRVAQRLERQERANRVERQQLRAAERQELRQNRIERQERVANREVRRENRALRIDDRLARIDRRENRAALKELRGSARAVGFGLGACPPGLMDKGCVPPGQALKANRIASADAFRFSRLAALTADPRTRILAPAQVVSYVGTPLSTLSNVVALNALPRSVQYLYPDTDNYYYRYGDGYIYRVERDNDLVSWILPALAGGLLPGQYLPASYMNSYVPDYYGLNSFYPSSYANSPYDCNRYVNGVIYEVDCYSGLIEDVIPLYANGYGVGQMLPASYGYYNVPYQYRDLYYNTPQQNYWYSPGAIYQVDPTTQLITAVASLLAPGLTIGQQLPLGYNTYNVPMAYRDTYYDTPNAWYRYNNGYIYQVDPTTQLVTAIVASILT